jgi:hypothetical protein
MKKINTAEVATVLDKIALELEKYTELFAADGDTSSAE